MKNHTKIGLVAALVLGAIILALLQGLLVPKYVSSAPEGNLIAEYYDNAGSNDVIFIGDCEVYENFSPPTLWEEYGITSYIRGSAQQMIWQSYYLMEETFRYETPQVMVFNVLSMMYDTPQSTGDGDKREAYNRMTLDGMRLSSSKLKSVMASLTEEEKTWNAQYSYLFPLLRFHSRWSELSREDVEYMFKRPRISDNGYLMQTGVKPVTAQYAVKPLADYSFGENSYYYLDKMRELCRSHGTQLVLIKAPSLYPVWHDEWDEQIAAYADEHGLMYINLLAAVDDIGIDWSTDTYDAGLHLNVHGAEKLSHYFGELLASRCGVTDHRDDPTLSASWGEKLETYNLRKTQE